MNRIFSINFRVRRFALRLNAFFLIVLFSLLQSASFGQTTALTRAQFSRFSVVQRARFFEPTISRIAVEEQVDPYLLWTIAYNETRFRPWLRSYAGAEGLMQFIPATALRFNLFNPYQPEPAIRAAARYVRFLSNRFGGRIDSILAGYNAGEGAVDAFLTGKTVRAGGKIINGRGIKTIGGVPPYQETIGYVARGLVVYRLLRTRQMFPSAIVSSVYPLAVSESVARVWLRDPEIGFNGSLLTQISNLSFVNAELTQQNDYATIKPNINAVQAKIQSKNNVRTNGLNFQTNLPIPSAEAVSKDSINNGSSENKTAVASNEVYYEPRTGGRFQTRNGKMERLAESGELVVGEQLRATESTAIRARGTFFGGNSAAPKNAPSFR
ncbi:MAG: lytic transglycosylase domain-containing protein [Acidobacteriota bacterium]|nr:lytic transglycosylase domain-containing protein [Acidobacteriota bacterium]